MKPSSGALVILDCDGVLFDSFEANVSFYDAVLERLGEPPLDDAGREQAHSLSTPQLMQWLFADDPVRRGRAEQLVYEVDYRPFLRLLRPVPDLFETLAWLRRNYRTAMATNRGATISSLLEHFDLTAWFELVVGIHDVPRPKPAPDMLLRCLEHLAVDAENALFVGDSPGDRAAADAARVRFVAVGDATGHEARIAELRELPGHLRRA